MNMPRFTAEKSLYTTREHYVSAGLSGPGGLDSIVAESLFCSKSGEKCGGIDLVCCPGLQCSTRAGDLSTYVPDLFRCSPCVDDRQFCCPPPGFGLRCFVRKCVTPM